MQQTTLCLASKSPKTDVDQRILCTICLYKQKRETMKYEKKKMYQKLLHIMHEHSEYETKCRFFRLRAKLKIVTFKISKISNDS